MESDVDFNYMKNLHSLTEARAHTNKDIAQLSVDDITTLVNELESHQIELEMENEVLRNTQLELVDARDQYAEFYNFAPVGYLTLGVEGLILKVNLTLSVMLGEPRKNLINKPLSSYIAKEDKDNYYLHLNNVVKTQLKQHGELRLLNASGDLYWISIESIFLRSTGGEGDVISSVLSDITEQKQVELKIQHLAFYDSLTDLPNRQLLQDRFKQALVSNGRNKRYGALLFIDLDNFKTLNDTLGHDAGDILLKQISQRLVFSVREVDTVARLGGDEFVVMLLDLSGHRLEAAAKTKTISEKILATLRQPCELDKNLYYCTASIGAVIFNDPKLSVEELMKQADMAMYQAKKAGRNTLRFFDHQMQTSISERNSLESELQMALEFQQFQLHYQIQVDSQHQPFAAEALIRWNHPVRGLLSANHFIPLAEETGLILPVGFWVLEAACAQIKAWQMNACSRNLVLSINISSKQFHQADFVAQIQAALQRHAINPKLLKLELTESLLQVNIEQTIVIMRALSEIGVTFAIDDFGAGCSSLQFIKQLPFDQLKIDPSFLPDVDADNSDKTIVSTIIAMAKILELEVIAEGVETIDQRQFILDSGCTHFQGYLLGKPMPIEQFDRLLM